MRLSPIHHSLTCSHLCEFAGGTRFRMWLRKGVLYSAICANYRLPQKDRRKGRSTLDGQAGFFLVKEEKNWVTGAHESVGVGHFYFSRVWRH